MIPLQKGVDQVSAANLDNQTAPRLYDAVKVASKQPESCPDQSCTASGPRYYLFNKETKEPIGSPEADKADLFVSEEAKALPKDQREMLEVKPGTVVVQRRADQR